MTQREGGFAADYIPVAERIAAFYKAHPQGSLQSELIELSESRVVMRGLAYRTAEDIRPGIGFSSLEIPGRTPYTRGSEIENCETSAWGRAIAALGFEVKRGIATAEEVRNKSTSHGPAAEPSPAAAVGSRPGGRGPDAPSSGPSEPDYLASSFHAPATATESHAAPAADGGARMTMRELFAAAETAGIDKTALGAAARKLWGKGMIRDLDDEQRAVIWAEVSR